ncbi:MAG TPA: alpha/beta fold hydrolase [Acidobacteriota bacterium]|nr:alpha/beta fold hydrolase [Acidobacteriota bacterium]
MYRKRISASLAILLIFCAALFLQFNTGTFSGYAHIDDKDLRYWNYSGEVITGAQDFTLNGSTSHCWLLLHSFTATPAEMKETAFTIHDTFNDTVRVPRLTGHGEVPSHITGLTLDDWYLQIQAEYAALSSSCDQVNVVGSSYGGTLAYKLSQDLSAYDKLGNVYILNGYLGTSTEWYYPPPDRLMEIGADSVLYQEKWNIAQSKSAEGRAAHIAYWTFPLETAKNSLTFVRATLADMPNATAPKSMLIMHSHKDRVADPKKVVLAYEQIPVSDKDIRWFDDSNHVLLIDVSRKEVVQSIIDWEKVRR